jgi:DNA-binding transcriptional LysR family regulator
VLLKNLSKLATLSTLRYFYEVARAGSIRAAAESLFIAPSAVSRQIRLLEDDLGTPLLTRHSGGVELTPAGKILNVRTVKAMQELAEARREIEALDGQACGTVRVGVNETIAREFMRRFLIDFHHLHPHVVPVVQVANTATLLDALLRRDLDIIVGYGVPDHDELVRLNSCALTVCAMLGHGHPLAAREFLSIKDLSSESVVLPDETLTLRRIIDNLSSAHALRLSPILETNSFEMMAGIVSAGFGVGFQVRLRVGPDEIRPNIVYVPIQEAMTQPVALACCMLHGRIPGPAHEIFAQSLSQTLLRWVS